MTVTLLRWRWRHIPGPDGPLTNLDQRKTAGFDGILQLSSGVFSCCLLSSISLKWRYLDLNRRSSLWKFQTDVNRWNLSSISDAWWLFSSSVITYSHRPWTAWLLNVGEIRLTSTSRRLFCQQSPISRNSRSHRFRSNFVPMCFLSCWNRVRSRLLGKSAIFRL